MWTICTRASLEGAASLFVKEKSGNGKPTLIRRFNQLEDSHYSEGESGHESAHQIDTTQGTDNHFIIEGNVIEVNLGVRWRMAWSASFLYGLAQMMHLLPLGVRIYMSFS